MYQTKTWLAKSQCPWFTWLSFGHFPVAQKKTKKKKHILVKFSFWDRKKPPKQWCSHTHNTLPLLLRWLKRRQSQDVRLVHFYTEQLSVAPRVLGHIQLGELMLQPGQETGSCLMRPHWCSRRFGNRRSENSAQPGHYPTGWPCVSHYIFLEFRFFMCQQEIFNWMISSNLKILSFLCLHGFLKWNSTMYVCRVFCPKACCLWL